MPVYRASLKSELKYEIEEGTQGSFFIEYHEAPASDITVETGIDDPNMTIIPSSVTFTENNRLFDKQWLTIYSKVGIPENGDINTQFIFKIVSDDPNFAKFKVDSVPSPLRILRDRILKRPLKSSSWRQSSIGGKDGTQGRFRYAPFSPDIVLIHEFNVSDVASDKPEDIQKTSPARLNRFFIISAVRTCFPSESSRDFRFSILGTGNPRTRMTEMGWARIDRRTKAHDIPLSSYDLYKYEVPAEIGLHQRTLGYTCEHVFDTRMYDKTAVDGVSEITAVPPGHGFGGGKYETSRRHPRF